MRLIMIASFRWQTSQKPRRRGLTQSEQNIVLEDIIYFGCGVGKYAARGAVFVSLG